MRLELQISPLPSVVQGAVLVILAGADRTARATAPG
jgi:hypothetical protein